MRSIKTPIQVRVTKDATILVPNGDHKNFTETDNYIPKGTELIGELKHIKGKRRGQDFIYRLFQTKSSGNLIYQNSINPIKMTEVQLGADSSVAPTRIELPNEAKYANAHIIGAVGGSLAGFAIAKKMKKTKKQVYVFAICGALAGYVAGRMVSGKPVINVTLGS
tara:strand:- start:149 stop:643 length:495 start_codon:yes stop_codon:yes gene_type:complete